MGSDLLDTALRAAAPLGASAIWHSNVCGWLADVGRGVMTTTGSSLYNGQAGIALFLLHLHRLTGDKGIGRLAEGALNRLVLQLESGQGAGRPSFYLGSLGGAFVLFEAARLRSCARLKSLAETIVRANYDLWRQSPGDAELLDGEAGVLSFALDWGRRAASSRSMDWALGCRDRIASAAVVHEAGGVAWPTRRLERLTGMAHGVSGVIYALSKLEQAAPGEGRNDLIEAGLEFERLFFDPLHQNWRDLRGGDDAPARFQTAWCHGAPGIALARLTAAEVSDDKTIGEEARVALATTSRWVTKMGSPNLASDSLCHGGAGNAEILWCAAQSSIVCSPEREQFRETSLNWVAGLEQRLARNSVGGANLAPLRLAPGLFTGWSGLGYAVLRIHDSSGVPSVL